MYFYDWTGELTSQKGLEFMDELQTLIDKWDLILSTFKEEHEIIDVSFKTWIKPLKIYKLDGNVLTLTFSSLEDDASTDERSIVYIEKRYLKFLEVTVCEVMNKEYQVIIMSSAEKKEDELKKKTSSVSTDNSLASQNLNPNYTFDTFVIGTNNNLAHAASLAVAETPGQIYTLCSYTEVPDLVKLILCRLLHILLLQVTHLRRFYT